MSDEKIPAPAKALGVRQFLAAPPVRPPAPIRVDEEALGRALAPVVAAMERLANAAEQAAKILAEWNAQSVRAKRGT